MARKFSQISTRLWNSKQFNAVSDECKLLYMYFHTCPHVNSSGCFLIKIKYIEADLNWSNDKVLKGIDTLSKGLIEFNLDEELVKICRFLDHSPIQNKNHGIGVLRILGELPDCKEKLSIYKELVSNKYCEGYFTDEFRDTLSIPYLTTETDTETDTETIPKQIPKEKPKRQIKKSENTKSNSPSSLSKEASGIINSRMMNK